jgi:hypothetical protein
VSATSAGHIGVGVSFANVGVRHMRASRDSLQVLPPGAFSQKQVLQVHDNSLLQN